MTFGRILTLWLSKPFKWAPTAMSEGERKCDRYSAAEFNPVPLPGGVCPGFWLGMLSASSPHFPGSASPRGKNAGSVLHYTWPMEASQGPGLYMEVSGLERHLLLLVWGSFQTCLEWSQVSHVITLSLWFPRTGVSKIWALGTNPASSLHLLSFMGTQPYPLVYVLSVAAVTPELSIVTEAIWLIFKKNKTFSRKSFPHSLKVLWSYEWNFVHSLSPCD